MKLHERLERLAHEILHHQHSKVSATNKAKRLMDAAEEKYERSGRVGGIPENDLSFARILYQQAQER